MTYDKQTLYKEFKEIKPSNIEATLGLLAEGNTIPFIARYRKEVTGSLDEVQIQEISKRHVYLESMFEKKMDILRLIEAQDKLTPELKEAIEQAETLAKLDDLYRPYKAKKRTKATIAREKGLEPLALEVLGYLPLSDPQNYINEELEVLSVEEVWAGVHEILAEIIGDEAKYRDKVRFLFQKEGVLSTDVKDKEADEKSIYEMYYEYKENIVSIPSHRVLAINRGEKENILRVKLDVSEEKIDNYFKQELIQDNDSAHSKLIKEAYEDSYKRFIKPAIEREIRAALTQKAEEQAISVFGENLRNLLLQAPLKGKTVLGFDPAYRTGCKLGIVDQYGNLQGIRVIYPHKPAPESKREEAKKIFKELLLKHNVDMVAIGNGTASRESETFVGECLKEMDKEIFYVIVNEAGASVYSASEKARKEFPDLQVEERSAISIARRLQDPLAELVKIDPKSIGVGQYQHDVSQKELNETLKFVVETAVNGVGVDVNTASSELLSFVSGLTNTTADNILKLRQELGGFKDRKEIKKVPRLGPKGYEQAIGFLRIPRGKNPLDNTGIHPENYPVVLQMLKDLDLKLDNFVEHKEVIEKIPLIDFSTKYDVGLETLKDIQAGLLRPGRDLRDNMEGPMLRTDVLVMEDLKPGMQLKGTVRNVVDFGAFVDIGVKQDGLVHISKLSKNFVKHPKDVVKVGDIVEVWVQEVDLGKQRIQLSMLPL